MRRAPHSYNPRYTHKWQPGRTAAASGQGLRAAPAKQHSGPQRSGPQQRHGAAAARAGLVAVVGGITARSCCTLRSSTGRAKQGGPPRGPPPPPIPPSASSSKAGPVGLASLLLQHRKSPPAISKPEGFFRQPRGGGRWHSISDAGPRTASWGVIQQWQLMKDACL